MRFAYFGIIGLIAATLAGLPFLPTQDGPVHLYYSVVLADLLRGGHVFASSYQIRNILAPYSFHWYLLILLNKAFDPLVSERLVAVIAIFGLGAGCWRLAKALNGSAPAMQMLFLPLLATWALYMGLFNFVLGIGTLFYLMGWWLDNEQHKLAGPRSALFFGGLMLLASMHPVALLMFFLFAGTLVIVESAIILKNNGVSMAVVRQIFRRKAVPLTCLGSGSLILLWIRHFVTAPNVAEQIPTGAMVGRIIGTFTLRLIKPGKEAKDIAKKSGD